MILTLWKFNGRRSASTLVDFGFQIKRLNDGKHFGKALALFNSQSEELKSNPVATNQALRACIELGDFSLAKRIHQGLSPYLLNNDFIRTSLIRLYMKSGNLLQAEDIFHQSVKKSAAMYVSMLNGLLNNSRAHEALNLLEHITVEPNEFLSSTIFHVCAHLSDDRALKFGKIHLKTMPERFRSNPIICTAALNMLVKCGDIASGEELFGRMEKNVFTYGAMMSGFVANKMPQKAIDLFLEVSKPNDVILSIFFEACAQLRSAEALDLGKKVFTQLSSASLLTRRVLESILNMFTKCGDERSAESLFNRLERNVFSYGSLMKMFNMKNEPEKTYALFEQMKKEKINPDKIIFTLLIDACSQIGDIGLCQSVLSQMPEKFSLDKWIPNALIDMWGKVGSIEEAKCIFDKLDRRDQISFTNMINAFGLNGEGREAVRLFRQVPHEMMDPWIYVCVLNACSHSGLRDEAKEIFNSIPIEQRTERIYTIMVDTYSRSSHFDEAQRFIDQFEEFHSPSLPMHMAILSGARTYKNVSLSQKIFDRIQQFFPNAKLSRTAATVLLANTYASHADFSKVSDVRMKMNHSGVKKKPGLSWTVVDGQVACFRAHDRSHPHTKEIYAESDRLTKKLIERGYKCDASWITRPLMNDETKESVLCGHSERLAIIFNLIQRPIPSRIQVAKNLRMCGDCHTVTKMIAEMYQRLIIVRDANRVHHFYPDGHCSCGDYF